MSGWVAEFVLFAPSWRVHKIVLEESSDVYMISNTLVEMLEFGVPLCALHMWYIVSVSSLEAVCLLAFSVSTK